VFSDILDRFQIYVITELGLSQETLSAYTRDVQEFLAFAGTHDLNPQHITDFVNHLHRLGLRSTTVRRKSMSIRCLCNCLISSDMCDNRLLDAIDPIKIDRRSLDVLDSKDVDVLVATVGKRVPIDRAVNLRRDVSIILLAYHSGLRVSEICNLNMGDINFDRREIRVMGKGNCERIVPTTSRCLNAIREYIDLERRSDSVALFVKGDKERITRRSVSNMITSISRRAGIRRTSAHTLRRSCATSLLNNGMDLELIRVFLGHRHLSSTESYLVSDANKLKWVHTVCHPFGANREN